MLTIEPTGAVLGATVRGIDVARPLREPDLGRILLALGKHGVLRFPDQHLDLGALKRFSEQFGEIQGGGNREHDPTQEYPEIDILSNLKENGKYIGSPDAGQDWHTDMTYREVPGFVNVLCRGSLTCYTASASRIATASPWAAPNFPTCTSPTSVARRDQDAARRHDGDPQHREILGAHAAGA